MPLPSDFALKMNRLKLEAEGFRSATAGGALSATQAQKLGAMLREIVGLVEELGQCCQEKKGGDIVIKGKKILEN
jgi:hypothetical protein